MEQYMTFFSNEGIGLTSTSANHIANLAKEMISDLETSLAEMTLYSTTVTLIDGRNPNLLSQGADDAEIEDAVGKLHDIAAAKSLIAWLREAIKAKEKMLKEVSELPIETFMRENGIEQADFPQPAKALTEEEYYASKSADERCRYFSLEALAATLGKAVHPGGAVADARKQFQIKGKKPHDVVGEGRDTLVYSYTTTASEEAVEDVYFRLQAQYRDAQSQLNAMKHECKKAVEESEIAVRTDYSRRLADWTNERKIIEAKHEEYIKRRSQQIAALRIIIPQSLSAIYNTVNSLGK